jgi:hypothetical protein
LKLDAGKMLTLRQFGRAVRARSQAIMRGGKFGDR